MLLEFQSVRPALQAAFVIQHVANEANAGLAPSNLTGAILLFGDVYALALFLADR